MMQTLLADRFKFSSTLRIVRYDHHLTTFPCAVAIAIVFTACQAGDLRPASAAPILLFSGRGTSPGDVAAIERILSREHLEYSTIGTRQLNGLTESEIRKYRLLIVPGGNFEKYVFSGKFDPIG